MTEGPALMRLHRLAGRRSPPRDARAVYGLPAHRSEGEGGNARLGLGPDTTYSYLCIVNKLRILAKFRAQQFFHTT